MKTISVCMIVKNEEATLPLVLADVARFADEIVVVDTGSTDSTVQIAQKFTKNVSSFLWCDDFSAARNASFALAHGDYLMWLDADDRVPEASIFALNSLKGELLLQDMVMMPYETAFDSRGATFRFFRERLVRRAANFVWIDAVHEVMVPRGEIIVREIPIEHHKKRERQTDRNLNIYRGLEGRGVALSTRQKYYYANELLQNNLPLEALDAYRAFLCCTDAMIENRTAARLQIARLLWNTAPKEAFLTLMEGFFEAPPTAESLVELGHYFLRQENTQTAIFWYQAALNAPAPSAYMFQNKDMERYVPALQLALCYYKQNDKPNALRYNRMAIFAKPDSALAEKNQEFYVAMPN